MRYNVKIKLQDIAVDEQNVMHIRDVCDVIQSYADIYKDINVIIKANK